MSTTAPPLPTDTTPELTSIGRLCGLFQHDPRRIAHAARSAGVPVALRLNGIDHFDAAGVEKIATWFRERADQRGASPREQAGV